MSLMQRTLRASWLASRAATLAESARQVNRRATLSCVRAESAAERASWLATLARRVDEDLQNPQTPKAKISVLEGLAIAAEQCASIAQENALRAQVIAQPTAMSVALDRAGVLCERTEDGDES